MAKQAVSDQIISGGIGSDSGELQQRFFGLLLLALALLTAWLWVSGRLQTVWMALVYGNSLAPAPKQSASSSNPNPTLGQSVLNSVLGGEKLPGNPITDQVFSGKLPGVHYPTLSLPDLTGQVNTGG